MTAFLKSFFSSLKDLEKEELPGDGGHRQYSRIKFKDKSFLLMSCGAKDESLKKFIEIQKRLQTNVSVPRIFKEDLENGFLLLEDLGDQTLETFFLKEGEKASLSFYQQSLRELISFQSRIYTLPTDPLFDKLFFQKEMDMAIYHLEKYLSSLQKTSFKAQDSLNFKKDMDVILSHFSEKDYVYCHRDYHSRNLMIKEDKIFMIDFQDAGLGPWYYDLTSLLYDSYVPITFSMKKTLSGFYFEKLPDSLQKKVKSPEHIEYMSKLQFLQRGFKACGRFSAFKNLNQKNTHLKYLPSTLKLLKQTALELSYMNIYKYLNQMLEILETEERL